MLLYPQGLAIAPRELYGKPISYLPGILAFLLFARYGLFALL